MSEMKFDPREKISAVDLPGGLFDSKPENLCQLALEYYSAHLEGTDVSNAQLGKVRFTSEGAEAFKTLQQNILRMSTVRALRALVQVAVPFERPEGRDQLVYAVAPLRIDGVVYAIKLILRQDSGSWCFWDFQGFGMDQGGSRAPGP